MNVKNKLNIIRLAAFVGLVAVLSARSQDLSAELLHDLAKTYPFFIVLEGTQERPVRYLLADKSGHLHVYSVQRGRSVLEWQTASLGSRVSAIFVKDVNKDGKKEIVVGTKGGRIVAYDATNYEMLGENLLEPFGSVACITSANLDQDEQEEIIFIADGFLHVYDGLTLHRTWKSHETYTATELIVANVDDDEQLEIILNSGAVIDSRFYREDFNYTKGFGIRIRLIDLNGDGYPEIIGETGDFSLILFDIYAGREIW